MAKGGNVKVKWYGGKVIPQIKRKTAARLELAAAAIQNAAKEGLGREQPTKGTGLNMRGLDPSKRKEYPKVVTGHLRKNVFRTIDKKSLVARVGTNVKYGRYLELGTIWMQRRPWLSLALRDAMPEVRRLLGG